MIHYNDMLLVLHKKDERGDPLPFSLHYVKADRKRNTGGQDVSYPCAVMASSQPDRELPAGPTEAKVSTRQSKNPHHIEMGTINVMILPSRQLKKVHTRLITSINNEPVYW